MRVSTARSVSVTRSTAGVVCQLCGYRLWSTAITVLLGACVLSGGFCGDDALSRLFGYGDHEVMDLLEVEVCHFDLFGIVNQQKRRECCNSMEVFCLQAVGAISTCRMYPKEATPRWGTPAETDLQGPTRGEATGDSWLNGFSMTVTVLLYHG
jgi:hypothetical protein